MIHSPNILRSIRRAVLAVVWVAASSVCAHAEDSEEGGECGPFPADEIVSPTLAPGAAVGRGGETVPEVVVVLPRLPDGSIGAAEFHLAAGASIVESRWSPTLCATVARVTAPRGTDPSRMITSLPDGATAAPNDIYFSAATEPSAPLPSVPQPDPYRALQHGLDRTGIDAVDWKLSRKAPPIAILDSRPASDHPDLGGIRILETGRDAGLPGVHGTMIAGAIAATRDNGFGISGLLPHPNVLAVPVCQPATQAGRPDECRLYDLIVGSDLAWDAGARVFNLSLVGPANRVLERTVARLDRLGAVVVAAAGNEGVDEPRYPAAYPTVVAVGAVDRDGKPWARSNHGLAVEVTAPGVEIVSAVPGGGFAFSDGTSLATAHVSSMIAMLASVAPDPHTARRAFFEAGHARPDATRTTAALPTACEALARLGVPCDTPASGRP